MKFPAIQGAEKLLLKFTAVKDGVYGTAFSADRLLLADPDPQVSKVTEVDASRGTAVATRDVARFENLFWVVTPPKGVKDDGGFHPPGKDLQRMDEGRFVRFCDYGHTRIDAGSPGYRNPQFENDDANWWAGKASRRS